ncbi:protein of unknown function [Pseudodesulfovibrio piezophilus C1TLV30]|uniref:Uncharacterized protein n=1 Tax=Pseudodesulfovibrio piezophilus (strain DSM 21447 / JCM 15486 / C1TLV30) TaxID=1322246 RepID=M1WK24_PSEP2|nr:protein of unknown function [Pseudodesulfovibrio piezophilus C1TLV30]
MKSRCPGGIWKLALMFRSNECQAVTGALREAHYEVLEDSQETLFQKAF